jgi:hypothetical protein
MKIGGFFCRLALALHFSFFPDKRKLFLEHGNFLGTSAVVSKYPLTIGETKWLRLPSA